MQGRTDCYVLFATHTDGWALYEAVRQAGVAGHISPTPRAARASCGVSLLIECSAVQRVREIADAAGVTIEGVVELPRQFDANRNRFC